MNQQTLVDRPDVAETFADMVLSISTPHSLARVELGVARPHPIHGQPETVVIAARLLLSPVATATLAEMLGKAVEQFLQAGVLRREELPSTKQ